MTWHAKRWIVLVAVVVVEKIGNWELKSNTPDMTIQRDKIIKWSLQACLPFVIITGLTVIIVIG